ncbi:MAG TPA: HAD family hydrolase [Pilimelia sp.]|nr:HAD family hydrolase [Pilimelia sp.]
MPAYRAVLFDFFGTLTRAVRRGPQHDHIARALGCDPARMVAVLDRSFHDRCRGLLGDAAAALRWVCAQADGRPSPEALRMALVARVAAVQADTRLRPEAVPTLRELRRRGLRTAVVSDCGYELPQFLPRLPVAPLLDARVYSVAVRRRKPHPTMYLTACAALGVAPEECLYVGDGGSRELTGAAAVGMTAVRLAAEDLADHLVFDPDHAWAGPAIGTLGDVLAVVGTPSAGRAPALV